MAFCSLYRIRPVFKLLRVTPRTLQLLPSTLNFPSFSQVLKMVSGGGGGGGGGAGGHWLPINWVLGATSASHSCWHVTHPLQGIWVATRVASNYSRHEQCCPVIQVLCGCLPIVMGGKEVGGGGGGSILWICSCLQVLSVDSDRTCFCGSFSYT